MEIAAGWAGILSTLHEHDYGDDDYDDDSDEDDNDVEDDDVDHWQGVLQPSSNLFDWKLLAKVFLLPNIKSKAFTFITFTFPSYHKLKDFPVCIIHFHFPSTPQLQDVPFSSKINLSSKNKLKDLPFDNLHTLTGTFPFHPK